MKLFKSGKVFAFGEYAVVKGYPSLILKTHRGLHFELEAATVFEVKSSQLDYVYSESLNPTSKVEKAIHQALAYLKALKIDVKHCRIFITSTLEQSDTTSLGLGSSGAFVVGVIEAILLWNDVTISPLELFKLAVLSHQSDIDLTSYGDFAVSAFSQHLYYQKMSLIPKGELIDVLHQEWPDLEVKPFDMVFPWALVHINEKQSSCDLVKQVFQTNHSLEELFQAMTRVTTSALEAIHNQDKKSFLDCVNQAQKHMEVLSSLTNAPIMVHAYHAVLERTKQMGIACKISGAGGGDNLICFGSIELLEALRETLQSHYIVFEGGLHESQR